MMLQKSGVYYAGMEAGGTKFVCMVASGPENVRAETSFPTTKPQETLGRAVTFFKAYEPFAALGIGTFGPCDLNPASPAYGRLSTSIKPGWKEANMLEPFRQAFDVSIGIDTDVNVAALGEYTWGAGKGLDAVLYLTVGTGIGGGGVINGRMMHGLFHPEMGHIRLPRADGLTVKNRMGAVSGNVVKVGLDARTQRERFLLAFIIPLLSFVAGTVTGHFINTAFGVSSMEVAIGFISLVAAATLCFRRLKRLNSSSPIAIQAVVSACAFTGGSRPCS